MQVLKRYVRDSWMPAALAVLLVAGGRLVIVEPLGLALWCIVVAWLCVPLMWDEPRSIVGRYGATIGVVAVAALVFAGFVPALIVAAVAFSILGGVLLLTALRLPAAIAIGVVLVSTALAFTWPVWGATFITRVDPEPWLQWLINVSPAFALNAAISPEDPLTHRPLAYQLMNLGQDVMYSMPTSAWPCIVLHAAVGGIGACAWWVRSRGLFKARPSNDTARPTPS